MPSTPAELPTPKLKGRAKRLWQALAPGLYAAGLLTEADIPSFERYCRLHAAWETAMQEVEAGSGRSAVLTLAKLDEMVRKLAADFGLTPAARTGMKVEQPGVPDSKSRFFRAAG